MTETTITAKVKKLLALAGRAGTEAEAASAAAMAQSLIEKHNLSIGNALEQEGAVVRETGRSVRISPHAVVIARAVCAMFDSDFYVGAIEWEYDPLDQMPRRNLGRSLHFVGIAANVEACVLTFAYLLASVESLLKGSSIGLVGGKDFRAYRLGCALRLSARIDDAKTQSSQAGGEATMALVRVSSEIAKKYIDSLYMGRPKGFNTRIDSGQNAAYSRGYSDGGRVDIQGGRSSRMLK